MCCVPVEVRVPFECRVKLPVVEATCGGSNLHVGAASPAYPESPRTV